MVNSKSELYALYEGNEKIVEVSIEGNELSLWWLAEQLTLGKNALLRLALPKPSVLEFFDGYFTFIKISLESNPVNISAYNDELHISGSVNTLNSLADEIKFLLNQNSASQVQSSHIHIEYFEGHDFISSSSLPLIVHLL